MSAKKKAAAKKPKKAKRKLQEEDEDDLDDDFLGSTEIVDLRDKLSTVISVVWTCLQALNEPNEQRVAQVLLDYAFGPLTEISEELEKLK